MYTADIQLYTASTGGSPISPADIAFTTPTAAGQVQTVTLYMEATSAIPAGAMVSPCAPLMFPEVEMTMRNIQTNLMQMVQFSLDNVNFWTHLNLPALSVGLPRTVLYMRFTSPTNDNRVESSGTYVYPGNANDWPPLIGVEFNVVNRLIMLDGFDGWQTADTVDNFLEAQKWDVANIPLAATDYINYGGGRRGGKALQCPTKAYGLYQSRLNINYYSLLIESEWQPPVSLVQGFALCTGYNGTWTSTDVGTSFIRYTLLSGETMDIRVMTGTSGALLCQVQTALGITPTFSTVATITPTRTQTGFVYVEMAVSSAIGTTSYDYAFSIDGSVVASGTVSYSGSTIRRLGNWGVGAHEWTIGTPTTVDILIDDYYCGEVAAPINQCFLGDVAVTYHLPYSSGGYAGQYREWTGKVPAGASDQYTYVDETEWNKTDYVYAPLTPPGPKRLTFIVTPVPDAIIYGIQPYYIGGGDPATNPPTGDFSVSPILYDALSSRPIYHVHQRRRNLHNLPWEIAADTLMRDPFTHGPLTTARLNAFEVGVRSVGTSSTATQFPTATVVGMEVAYKILLDDFGFFEIVGAGTRFGFPFGTTSQRIVESGNPVVESGNQLIETV